MELRGTMTSEKTIPKTPTKTFHCAFKDCKFEAVSKPRIINHFKTHPEEGVPCPNPHNCQKRVRPDKNRIAKPCSVETRIFVKEELLEHKAIEYLMCKNKCKNKHFLKCQVNKCNSLYDKKGQGMYKCTVCSRGISSNQMLQKHMQSKHPEIFNEQKKNIKIDEIEDDNIATTGEEPAIEDMVRVQY